MKRALAAGAAVLVLAGCGGGSHPASSGQSSAAHSPSPSRSAVHSPAPGSLAAAPFSIKVIKCGHLTHAHGIRQPV